MTDRLAASVHRPTSEQRSLHDRQSFSVSWSVVKGSIGDGRVANESPWERTKATDSPASTPNSPRVLRSSPYRAMGARRTTRYGPAMILITPSSSRVTHGTVDP